MSPNYIVGLELIGLLGVSLIMFWSIWRKGRMGMPLWEVGPFYICIILLYTVVPLSIFLIRDHVGIPLTNGRLSPADVNMEDVSVVGMYGFIYLCAFGLGYLAVRGGGPSRLTIHQGVRCFPMWSVAVCLVLSQAFLVLANYVYAVKTGSYLDSYVAIANMPLMLKQLYGHMDGISIIYIVMLLGYCFSRFQRFKWLVYLIGLSVVISALYANQGRYYIIVFLFVSFCHYNQLVKRLRMVMGLFVCGFILATFIGLGFLRNGGSTEEMLLNGGEFEAVFVNALDVRAKQELGLVELSKWSVLLNPVTSVVPQQMLPFKKVVFSNWYLETFYSTYKDSGGGLAFGALAEAMLGFGIAGLAVRAMLLGLLLGVIHRWYARFRVGLMGWCFYTWLLLILYQCYRENTGAILIALVHMWLPAFGAVYILNSIFKSITRPRDGSVTPVQHRHERVGALAR